MKVIDMHCDTMKAILDNRDIGKNIIRTDTKCSMELRLQMAHL